MNNSNEQASMEQQRQQLSIATLGARRSGQELRETLEAMPDTTGLSHSSKESQEGERKKLSGLYNQTAIEHNSTLSSNFSLMVTRRR